MGMTLVQSEETWSPDFLPAVKPGTADEREPVWLALRFQTNGVRTLRALLDFTGQEHLYLTYHKKNRRRGKPPTVNAWIPGYIFVFADVFLDRWQQVLQMPHALGFLGRPDAIPADDIDKLRAACPERLEKPCAGAMVAVGSRVRIIRGPLAHNNAEGVVRRAERKKCYVVMMLFGRPAVDVELKYGDFEVIG
jgi:transcription antitermination factor NusG